MRFRAVYRCSLSVAHEQLDFSCLGSWPLFLFLPPTNPPTFLKKRASEPVRRGRPFPAWGSEVTAVVRPGEAVSRNCVLMAPEESQDRTGIRVMVRSLLRPARGNSIQLKMYSKFNRFSILNIYTEHKCVKKLANNSIKAEGSLYKLWTHKAELRCSGWTRNNVAKSIKLHQIKPAACCHFSTECYNNEIVQQNFIN